MTTTLSLKNLFLMSNLNFPCRSPILFPRVPPLVTRKRRRAASLPLPTLRKVQTARRSPLINESLEVLSCFCLTMDVSPWAFQHLQLAELSSVLGPHHHLL